MPVNSLSGVIQRLGEDLPVPVKLELTHTLRASGTGRAKQFTGTGTQAGTGKDSDSDVKRTFAAYSATRTVPRPDAG